jgi:3-methylfumaryl-CoA hydratase
LNDDLDLLRQWIGRTETCSDVAGAWPVTALAATLDRRDADPLAGDPIPPGWHWLFFLEAKPASELGPDGHTKRGGFLPPVPLPRRMWAGGRIEFLRPLRVGETLRRESEIVAVEPKRGTSGDLLFVTVRHTVIASGETATVEEHDIVYREAARPGQPQSPGRPAPANPEWRREIHADSVMLFRFSALIFNAHRIHYDLDYVRNEEHYPALVVHGPLQTILILDLARRQERRPVKKLDYRALYPLFHTERFTVNGRLTKDGSKAELWTANAAGICAMTGTVYF